jgi:hypothetical protein
MIKHIISGQSGGAWLEQLLDNLKAPQKASGLLLGPLVSFDTISDPQKGSQSLVNTCHGRTSQNSKLLFTNTTSVGKI